MSCSHLFLAVNPKDDGIMEISSNDTIVTGNVLMHKILSREAFIDDVHE